MNKINFTKSIFLTVISVFLCISAIIWFFIRENEKNEDHNNTSISKKNGDEKKVPKTEEFFFAGRVLNSQEESIANAEILLYGKEPPQNIKAFSDGQGRFSIKMNPQNPKLDARILAQGFEPLLLEGFSWRENPDPVFTLQPGASLEGFWNFSSTAKNIFLEAVVSKEGKDSWLKLWGVEENSQKHLSAIPNERGEFSLGGIPTGTYKLKWKDGNDKEGESQPFRLSNQEHWKGVWVRPGAPEKNRCSLEDAQRGFLPLEDDVKLPSVMIYGTLTIDGKKLDKQCVALVSANHSLSPLFEIVETDKKGKFKFPLVPMGIYDLKVVERGCRRMIYSIRLEALHKDNLEKNIELNHGQLRLKVRSDDRNLPLGDAQVFAIPKDEGLDPHGASLRKAFGWKSGEDEITVKELAPGEYWVRVFAEGHAPSENISCAVKPGEILDLPNTIVLGKLKKSRRVQGNILGLKNTPSMVELLPLDGQANPPHVFQPNLLDGFYQFNFLAPGNYAIRARIQDHPDIFDVITIPEENADRENPPILRDLKPQKGGDLRLKVFDEGGKVLRDANIRVTHKRTGNNLTLPYNAQSKTAATLTDHNGAFERKMLPEGSFDISVHKDGKSWDGVAVIESGRVLHIAITLK